MASGAADTVAPATTAATVAILFLSACSTMAIAFAAEPPLFSLSALSTSVATPSGDATAPLYSPASPTEASSFSSSAGAAAGADALLAASPSASSSEAFFSTTATGEGEADATGLFREGDDCFSLRLRPSPSSRPFRCFFSLRGLMGLSSRR